MKITIIIPVYNEESKIKKCLEAVYRSEYKNFEVIIVDDCSTDDSAEIARKFPCEIISFEKKQGVASARNAGAKASTGDILFFIDSDVLIKNDTIEKVAETFSKKLEISAIIGSYTKDTIFKNFSSEYKNLIHYYTHQTSSENACLFWTGCGAVKRSAFDDVGGFNEIYKSPAVEDIEFGYRLLKQGRKIYLDKEIQVTHLKKYSLFSLVKSDLFNRAIPWTQLMLTDNKFKNDQDAKLSNVLSVFASYLFLLIMYIYMAGFLQRAALKYILPCCVILFIILNYKIIKFVLKNRGWFFALKFILMRYVTNLYEGLGFIIGALIYLVK